MSKYNLKLRDILLSKLITHLRRVYGLSLHIGIQRGVERSRVSYLLLKLTNLHNVVSLIGTVSLNKRRQEERTRGESTR